MIKKLLINLAKHIKEITTLSNGKSNWITKVDETGLYVETTTSREKYIKGQEKQPHALIPYTFLLEAWHELLKNSGHPSKEEFNTTKGRSSFLRAFFHELPFVEKYQRGRSTLIRLKEFQSYQLPQARLEDVIALLDEIKAGTYLPERGQRSKAAQGLQLLGFLTEKREVDAALLQEYAARDKKNFIGQLQKQPYFATIYQLLALTDGFSKEERYTLLLEIGVQLLQDTAQGSLEHGVQYTLNWLEELGLVDSDWQVVPKTELRELLLRVMHEYVPAKQESAMCHPTAVLVRDEIPSYIRTLPFVTDHYVVSGFSGVERWTAVPRVTVMHKKVTTSMQTGYYVAYLFHEDMQRLYLALVLGSAEEMQQRKERIRTAVPMNNRVHQDQECDLGEAKRAKECAEGVMAYILYTLDNFPTEERLMKDLEEMLQYYEAAVDAEGYGVAAVTDLVHEKQPSMLPMKDVVRHIHTYIASKGFRYELTEVQNLYLSLRSKPFVILSGISGTGKTMAVKWLAESLGATRENGQFTLISVRPDWNDGSDLLGYVDIKGEFQAGPLTQVIQRALEHPDRPYFVLLDEMNLARVEYYFSDVLSVMESRELTERGLQSLPLIRAEVAGTELLFPANVYIVGTVNMDETTHPFSKKVLDRANTIEFNEVHLEDLSFLQELPVVEPIHLHNDALISSYVHLKDVYNLYADVVERATKELAAINHILKPIGAHIGYRVRDEICFYLAYNQQSELMEEEQAMDHCIMQKLLPRLAGSDARLERALAELYTRFTGKALPQDLEIMDEDIALSRYPRSTAKVIEMLRRLRDDGFTSFWIS